MPMCRTLKEENVQLSNEMEQLNKVASYVGNRVAKVLVGARKSNNYNAALIGELKRWNRRLEVLHADLYTVIAYNCIRSSALDLHPYVVLHMPKKPPLTCLQVENHRLYTIIERLQTVREGSDTCSVAASEMSALSGYTDNRRDGTAVLVKQLEDQNRSLQDEISKLSADATSLQNLSSRWVVEACLKVQKIDL